MILNKCLFCKENISSDSDNWNYCQTKICFKFFVRYLIDHDYSIMRMETALNNKIYTIENYFDTKQYVTISRGSSRIPDSNFAFIQRIELNILDEIIITPNNINSKLPNIITFS